MDLSPAREVTIVLLLGLAVLLGAAGTLAMLILPAAVDRLHYLGPVTGLAVPAVAVAVMIDASPLSGPGAKAALVAIVLLVGGPVLGHAIARADRVRRAGDRRPGRWEGAGGRRP
jgi:multisubunit Na+/H+ antiporter MnhG subunit